MDLLSIICSVLILIYWLVPENNRKKRILKMLGGVAIGNTIWQFILLIDQSLSLVDQDWPKDTPLCQALAFFLVYGALFEVTWIVSMCVDLFSIVFFSFDKKKRISLKIFVVFSAIGPLVVASVLAGTGSFGPNIIICYARRGAHVVLILLTSIALLFAFIIMVGYIAIGFKMYYLSRFSTDADMYKNSIRKIWIYPLIYLICWSPPTVWTFYELLRAYLPFEVALMVVFFGSMNGIANFLAYFLMRVFCLNDSTDPITPTFCCCCLIE